jgi:AcrR family transcriptional regulator
VQAASLYNHVRDRAELLEGIHELALEELADRIGDAVAGRAGADALVGLAEAHRRFARECPGRWAALQQPAAPSTATSPAAGRVASFTMAVLRGYGLPESELVHVTRFLGATLNGFLALERSGAFDHRGPEPEVSWSRALTGLDTLIRSWPTALDEGTPR